MRKNIITVLFLVLALCGGTLLGIGLMSPSIQQARDSTDYWHGRHSDLYDDYTDLSEDYGDLLNDYNTLVSDYNSLFGQYQSILNVLEDPLTNPVVPTISEVLDWLAIDDTDTLEYTQYWMCGDFSAMLMTRAKVMNWRIRISIMFWSEDGEPGYGDTTDPFGSYGHAFNMIVCSDGQEYYIEPQTDSVIYLSGSSFQIWRYYGFAGISGTVWDETNIWTNHYAYFA